MGWVLGTLGVGCVGFVIGLVCGARLADGDYEVVAIDRGKDPEVVLYRRRDDSWS